MALSEKTSTPVTSKESLFCRHLIKDDGRGMEFYFQSQVYIKRFNLIINPEQVLASLTPAKFLTFKPTLKFNISTELLNNPDDSIKKLIDLKLGDVVALDYAMSPELIPEGKNSRANVYADTTYLDIIKKLRHSDIIDRLTGVSVSTAA